MAQAADPLSTQQRRGFWLRTLHQWHWISSAICLIGMLLFAFTGITLNHAADIAALRGAGPVLAAVPRGGADPATLDGTATVVLGAEDAGLGDELLAVCDGTVTVVADGFESPYGMELLATAHWAATHLKPAPRSPTRAPVAHPRPHPKGGPAPC